MPISARIPRGLTLDASVSAVEGTRTSSIVPMANMVFTEGTSVGQIDKFYRKTASIAASGTDTIDLAGALTDEFGVALTFAKVRGIFIAADATNTNNVNCFAGTNPLVGLLGGTTPTVNLKPGEFFQWGTPGQGLTVTGATGDIITLTNSAGGTAVIYEIVVLGSSV